MNKEIIDFLEKNSTETKRNFDTKIYNTAQKIYGVKVPLLRDYAKDLVKREIDFYPTKDSSVEEKMLFGFTVGYKKLDYQPFVLEVEKFTTLIENWATCDTVVSSLKQIKKFKKEYFSKVKEYLESKNEFIKRFAIVVLIDYYIEDEYIDFILQNVEKISDGKYYVDMAIAWLLSVAYVKHKDKTEVYLKESKLNKFTFNKTLSKINDSFRVSKQDKINLKSLRKQ